MKTFKTYYWWGAAVTVGLAVVIIVTPSNTVKMILFGLQICSFVVQLVSGLVMIRRNS